MLPAQLSGAAIKIFAVFQNKLVYLTIWRGFIKNEKRKRNIVIFIRLCIIWKFYVYLLHDYGNTKKYYHQYNNAVSPFENRHIRFCGSRRKYRKSDIDILYQLKDTVGLFNLVRMKDNLEQKLNKKVDLVSKKHIHPGLKPYIIDDLKIIYKNE